MEEINHFSHEKHPLQLINGETIVSVRFKGGDNEQKPEAVGCFACVKPISPSQVTRHMVAPSVDSKLLLVMHVVLIA
ncbi:hypothetical protein Tco_1267959 [Tanacetum coccineum]